ncbi:remorin-like [Prosopis cineraria]|uniref:remorin-like n=1 Tax=Prosopis cineraria TaxID=364024 RepID=UPI002410479A|nr:remorin-like [Prosopis cineraria]
MGFNHQSSILVRIKYRTDHPYPIFSHQFGSEELLFWLSANRITAMAEEAASKLQPQSQPETQSLSEPVNSSPDSSVKESDSAKEEPPNGVVQVHLSTVQKVADPPAKKDSKDLVDRDSVLARVETEKRLALIKAWEESEKTKADNKAYKKHSAVGLWEDSKKASVEAQLKKIEEKPEKKKAAYVEKAKNKIAEIHQLAEEKRAMVEAQRREENLKVEETASKFRASGYTPRKFLACFSA